ncbi:MAG: arginine--tRNA ligase [Clostridium sp.]
MSEYITEKQILEELQKIYITEVVDILKQTNNEENINIEQLKQNVQKANAKQTADIAIANFNIVKILKKSPQEISKEIMEKIANSIKENWVKEYIYNIEVVGGYINITYNMQKIRQEALKFALIGQKMGYDSSNNDKMVLIDYSSPNIAKQFHIGHLKTTVIGNMLYRLYRHLGYNVYGINHLGDYGTQFGKLIEGYNLWKEEYSFEENPIEVLNDIYVRINALCKEDETVLQKCRDNFKKLEEKDPEMVEIWQKFKDISMIEFNKIYDILNVRFDSYRGESAYSDKMKEVTQLLESKDLIKVSEGAKIIDLEEDNLGIVVVEKANGSSMYITRDIAAILYRIQKFDYYKCLYVVGSEQILHFKQLFKIIEKLGVDKKYIEGTKHIPYGMVSLPSGKMSTRLGNVIKIEDLLKESIKRTRQILDEKNELSEEEKEVVAKQVGIGAIIFSNLSTVLVKDQVFVWDNVLDFTGDTAPYIQYVNVRINSILKEAKNTEKYNCNWINDKDKIMEKYLEIEKEYNEKAELRKEKNGIHSKEADEIFKKILEFEEVLLKLTVKHEPYILTNYVLEIAKLFNKYYNNYKILTDDISRDYGLIICIMIQKIISVSFDIFGIELPDKM